MGELTGEPTPAFRSKPLNDRQNKFIEIYSRCANATRAAKEAGYSERTAYAAGSRLLRVPEIRNRIAARNISRVQHGEETYRRLILLADLAMKHVTEAFMKKSRLVSAGKDGVTLMEVEADDGEKSRAIEAAGRQLERLAKCEGLMILPEGVGEQARSSFQQIIQVLHQTFNVGPGEKVPAALIPLNGNGNGNGHAAPANGNGHSNGNGHGEIRTPTEEGNSGGNGKDH